jgi:hypothetical protein
MVEDEYLERYARQSLQMPNVADLDNATPDPMPSEVGDGPELN